MKQSYVDERGRFHLGTAQKLESLAIVAFGLALTYLDWKTPMPGHLNLFLACVLAFILGCFSAVTARVW